MLCSQHSGTMQDSAEINWGKHVFLSRFPSMQLVLTKFASDIVARHKTLWSYWESLPPRRIQRCRETADTRQGISQDQGRGTQERQSPHWMLGLYIIGWVWVERCTWANKISLCWKPYWFWLPAPVWTVFPLRCSLTWKNSLFYFPKHS